MIDDHCMVCGVAWHVHRCTVEACANAKGAAEVERMRAEQAAMANKPWEPKESPVLVEVSKATNIPINRLVAPPPQSDLDVLRAMLERSGVPFRQSEAAGDEAQEAHVHISASGFSGSAWFWFDKAGTLKRVDGGD
jgi:hypothetical protein